MTKKDETVKFISPWVANNVQWLSVRENTSDIRWREQDFYYNATVEIKPDIIAVHAYAMDLEGIKNIIDKYRGFGKPLWITEFCMTVSFPPRGHDHADHKTFGGAAPKDQQAVHDFMGQVTKFMDEDPQIEWVGYFYL